MHGKGCRWARNYGNYVDTYGITNYGDTLLNPYNCHFQLSAWRDGARKVPVSEEDALTPVVALDDAARLMVPSPLAG
jgi:hypothetical protein